MERIGSSLTFTTYSDKALTIPISSVTKTNVTTAILTNLMLCIAGNAPGITGLKTSAEFGEFEPI